MPFRCKSDITGEMFNPTNREHLANWGTGEWLTEDGQPWTPTDVHGATAHNAFPDVERGTAEFKKLRSIGKTLNFAKNYLSGMGGIKKAMKSVQVEQEILDALDKGYYKAFPKVIEYQQSVIEAVKKKGYVFNQFGRRYYCSDTRWAYKFCNYLIQGSSADFLKEKMIEVHKFLIPYKTRLQMNIHDELSFEVWRGEEHLIPKLKEIMEKADWASVPIVADVEVSYTNWAEKEDVK